MQAAIQKWGNSNAVRIPKPLLDSARLKRNDPIQIIAVEGRIIIQRDESAPAHIPLARRIKEAGETAADYADFKEWDSSSVGEEVFW
jgi:antitoxin MazE